MSFKLLIVASAFFFALAVSFTVAQDGGITGAQLNASCAAMASSAKCCSVPLDSIGVLCADSVNDDGPACDTAILYTQPRCCRTDILNVADLDCSDPQAQGAGTTVVAQMGTTAAATEQASTVAV